ncbi:HisA/HisF-related TIM barrel protein [Gammaproteobacteria bacterium]|jgi:imidazole glycerol phosphate synthase subunit HisF|nr:HisA/HisF-related TIM barrel protein [Gammaproteobacteria bacterium]
MRVGSTLLLKNEKCYQSYNWSYFRPLGSLQTALDSLDEYECDEIAIIRPVRACDSLDLFSQDLDVLREIKTMTPICFGGGIRSSQHLELLEGLPVERLVFSSAFIESNEILVDSARQIFGKQAIQCLLPIKIVADNVYVYDSNKAKFIELSIVNLTLINELANEVIIYDANNDGGHDSFNKLLIERLPIEKHKLVVTGGVGKSTIDWARRKGLASVLIDNKVLHKEYSIRGFKNGN